MAHDLVIEKWFDEDLDPTGNITGTGSLNAQAADITGVGITSSNGTGVLVAQAADITGVGELGVRGTGVLNAQDANIDGTGLSSSSGTGNLLAQAAIIIGVGTVSGGPGGGFWFNYDQRTH